MVDRCALENVTQHDVHNTSAGVDSKIYGSVNQAGKTVTVRVGNCADGWVWHIFVWFLLGALFIAHSGPSLSSYTFMTFTWLVMIFRESKVEQRLDDCPFCSFLSIGTTECN